MLAAHEQYDPDIISLANLLNGRCQPFALRGARGAVVEVAVHVSDFVLDGHPDLSRCGPENTESMATMASRHLLRRVACDFFVVNKE